MGNPLIKKPANANVLHYQAPGLSVKNYTIRLLKSDIHVGAKAILDVVNYQNDDPPPFRNRAPLKNGMPTPLK